MHTSLLFSWSIPPSVVRFQSLQLLHKSLHSFLPHLSHHPQLKPRLAPKGRNHTRQSKRGRWSQSTCPHLNTWFSQLKVKVSTLNSQFIWSSGHQRFFLAWKVFRVGMTWESWRIIERSGLYPIYFDYWMLGRCAHEIEDARTDRTSCAARFGRPHKTPVLVVLVVLIHLCLNASSFCFKHFAEALTWSCLPLHHRPSFKLSPL